MITASHTRRWHGRMSDIISGQMPILAARTFVCQAARIAAAWNWAREGREMIAAELVPAPWQTVQDYLDAHSNRHLEFEREARNAWACRSMAIYALACQCSDEPDKRYGGACYLAHIGRTADEAEADAAFCLKCDFPSPSPDSELRV